ncbi:MAG: ABC transporter ATP-binding protein [Bacteroidales bacterium]|nr:ABC transporter ATP-binding protein [Bacteroidales bacterium]
MEESKNILIELHNISAAYNGEDVLQEVNFKICERDFIGVIGPNGGGKTTLVKVILGLLKPRKGKIFNHIDGNEESSCIGYLPQINNIDKRFPISVKEVVLSGFMFKMMNKRTNTQTQVNAANDIMKETGIFEIKDKPIGELSGGQMQRVLLCRSVVSNPRLLILDEPNTFVDNQFEGELYKMLKRFNKSMAIVMISHDVGMISAHVKTIACVNRALHYHQSNIITEQQLKEYNCPIQLITHGEIPHTVLKTHNH